MAANMTADTLTPNPDDPRDSPDDPQIQRPSTVATPEGDNEFTPGEVLTPTPDGLQRFPSIDTNKL